MSGNSRAAGGLGDQDPDLLLLISSYLDARDLARLSLTGRRTLVRIADEAARHAVESRAPGLFPKYDDETWTLALHHQAPRPSAEARHPRRTGRAPRPTRRCGNFGVDGPVHDGGQRRGHEGGKAPRLLQAQRGK
mmetsp:Transcript_4855/g.10263  ORF Transcript_4855/g.10263 Transcript_4855/m.10263 type:complete len:135 (-) Transcript_4855:1090-1494(-)